MKKILIVFLAGFTIVSCKDADKKAVATTSDATNAVQTLSKDSIDKLNAISNAANNPNAAIQTVDSANMTTIEWLDGQDKDFGKIKEGENLDVSFRFKNTGNKPLVISRVWAQCGCTVPETPQKPYAPGETGTIKASFNSVAKVGVNTKEVYMSANTNPGTSTLVFHVDVKPKG